jgi:hypothetical protein
MLNFVSRDIDRELLCEVIDGAVRAAAHAACACGCVSVQPGFAAEHVVNRLEQLGLRFWPVAVRSCDAARSAQA